MQDGAQKKKKKKSAKQEISKVKNKKFLKLFQIILNKKKINKVGKSCQNKCKMAYITVAKAASPMTRKKKRKKKGRNSK